MTYPDEEDSDNYTPTLTDEVWNLWEEYQGS